MNLEKLPKEMPAHLSLRKIMKWKHPNDVYVSVSNMTEKQILIAKSVLEKHSTSGSHIWNGYSKDAWMKAFQMESIYKKELINSSIKNNFSPNFPCTKEGRLVSITDAIKSNENVNRLLRRLILV